MKNLIIRTLHGLLGYENYLTAFSIWKVRTLAWDSRKKAYRTFLCMLSATDTVVVVGANTGITTIPFKRTAHVKQLFSYEPVRSNFETLRRVINHFGYNSARVFNVALGANNGTAIMVVPRLSGTRKHGLAYIDGKTFLKHETGDVEEVQLATLDSRRELHGVQVDAMKVVAENSELEIFKGARDLIMSNQPLIYCELWDNNRRAEVIDLIRTFGYNVLVYYKGSFHQYLDGKAPSRYFLFSPETHL